MIRIGTLSKLYSTYCDSSSMILKFCILYQKIGLCSERFHKLYVHLPSAEVLPFAMNFEIFVYSIF